MKTTSKPGWAIIIEHCPSVYRMLSTEQKQAMEREIMTIKPEHLIHLNRNIRN